MVSEEQDVETDLSEVSMTPLIDIVWAYRRVILLGAVTATLLLGILLAGLYLFAPAERIASIGFRVDMQGANQGLYPNGLKFSPQDIIATPVLGEVFKANRMEERGSFDEFAQAFVIESWSLKRDAIAREYEARLSDTRLSPVDRSRLEDEFQNKLKALTTPEYRLSFRKGEGLLSPPAVLLNKILEDTLATWSKQAKEQKGALEYDLPSLSTKVLDWSAIEASDHLIGIDQLRSRIIKMLEVTEELSNRSGTNAMRAGPDQLTLAELRLVLQDLLRFKVEPLSIVARNLGVARDLQRVRAYFEAQLFHMQRQSDDAVRKAEAVEASLQHYLNRVSLSASRGQSGSGGGTAPQGSAETLMPQMSESFLDRLIRLSSQGSDILYRQTMTDELIKKRIQAAVLQSERDYYENRLRGLSGLRSGSAAPAQLKAIERELRETYDRVSWAMTHVSGLYEQFSLHNLNPATMLYTITLPATHQRVASLSLKKAALAGALGLVVAVLVLIVGCLAHYHFRRGPHARVETVTET